jgi:hypothetical protein
MEQIRREVAACTSFSDCRHISHSQCNSRHYAMPLPSASTYISINLVQLQSVELVMVLLSLLCSKNLCTDAIDQSSSHTNSATTTSRSSSSSSSSSSSYRYSKFESAPNDSGKLPARLLIRASLYACQWTHRMLCVCVRLVRNIQSP